VPSEFCGDGSPASSMGGRLVPPPGAWTFFLQVACGCWGGGCRRGATCFWGVVQEHYRFEPERGRGEANLMMLRDTKFMRCFYRHGANVAVRIGFSTGGGVYGPRAPCRVCWASGGSVGAGGGSFGLVAQESGSAEGGRLIFPSRARRRNTECPAKSRVLVFVGGVLACGPNRDGGARRTGGDDGPGTSGGGKKPGGRSAGGGGRVIP